MMNPTYPAGGDGGGSAPPPGGRYRRRYLGTQAIAASGTWSKAAALALPMLAGIAEADLEVDVECVGGGASGWHGLVRGGAPGAVVRRTRALADLPEGVPVTIGAGGPVPPSSDYSGYCNAGGATSFGDIATAAGGLGIADGNWAAGAADSMLPSSDVGLAAPRVAGFGQAYTTAALPAASLGPGAGGAGIVNGNGGTAGGASGSGSAATRLEGGARGAAGANAASEWSYGSGGGGATPSAFAGKGGIPGGGGGGGRTSLSNGSGGWEGAAAGGAGVLRLRFYVWESV